VPLYSLGEPSTASLFFAFNQQYYVHVKLSPVTKSSSGTSDGQNRAFVIRNSSAVQVAAESAGSRTNGVTYPLRPESFHGSDCHLFSTAG
jgi:hypothetical protein